MKQVTQIDLDSFISELNTHVKNDYNRTGFRIEGPTIEVEVGKKYARLVAVNHGQRCAFGFIDMTNGNLMKAAGWKAPAKNFARGNIFTETKFNRISWTGVA